MTLPDLGAINNDERNVYCDPLNLSHVTKRYLKTKLITTPHPGNGICTLLCVVSTSVECKKK
jgi:hypothetical protein